MDVEEFTEKQTLDLISAYFKDHSLLRHQFESFQSFIDETIQQIINQTPHIEISKGDENHTIRFGNLWINKPLITEADGETTLLLPKVARARNCTYASPMRLEMSLQMFGKEAKKLSVYIGKVPMMLHSIDCSLHDKSPEDLMKMGECPYDKGGYFIVNGVERVIIAQEKMATNRVYVFGKAKANNYEHIGEVHSKNQNGSQSTMYVRMLSNQDIRCTLPFIKEPIPIVVVFRALGFSSDREIVQSICYGPDTEMQELLWASLEEAPELESQEVALAYIGKRGVTNPENNVERISYAIDILQKEMLPHVGVNDGCMRKKAYYLGYMIHRLLLCALGRRQEDDKDHYSNKRLDLVGSLFGELFGKLFRNLTRDIRASAQKCLDSNQEIDLETIVTGKIITNGFNFALATGNWGANRVGVSQLLDRVTYMSTLSHLRRTRSSVRPEGKVVVKPRQLHTSQWGMMCPVETPKGDTCGLVKNLALMAHITVGTATDSIINFLQGHSLMDFQDFTLDTLSDATKVFVNGDWVGAVNYHPGVLVTILKDWMKEERVDPFISITKHSSLKEVRIYTDSGRCMRPLFTVENQRLKIKNYEGDLNPTIRGLWQRLVEKGFIEYKDAEEEETTMISISVKNLMKERMSLRAYCETYTHCEIHPSIILGVSASVIPFPNHNQSPRNTYQCSMGKQAIGMYAMNYRSRMDTRSSVLCYPQRALVNTMAMKDIDLKELPAGTNAIVAISYLDGYNEGDAIVMNQSSIDRGFFRSLSFRTYRDQVKTDFGRPSSKMLHLDEDGLPYLGTRLSSQNVIIGKSGDVVRSLKKHFYDNGIVDQVMLTTDNLTGFRSAEVKTRTVRTPQIGDKFSSRHSQKGVIGMTISQEDMPWTMRGITPDIVINPHSIPSRMTMGQLLECLMGKKLAVKGLKEDVVPFTEVTVDYIRKILHESGYQKDGLEKMYDGHTGRPISSMIFTGPTYYQRLAHFVEDKRQSRAQGEVDNLTRQPVEGRSRCGGLRLGEMERDSLISHGGSLMLKERLLYQSDPYGCFVCQRCGFLGFLKGIEFKCKSCQNMPSEFVEVQIPYAFKLLVQELMSMGIGLSLRTRDST